MIISASSSVTQLTADQVKSAHSHPSGSNSAWSEDPLHDSSPLSFIHFVYVQRVPRWREDAGVRHSLAEWARQLGLGRMNVTDTFADASVGGEVIHCIMLVYFRSIVSKCPTVAFKMLFLCSVWQRWPSLIFDSNGDASRSFMQKLPPCVCQSHPHPPQSHVNVGFCPSSVLS